MLVDPKLGHRAISVLTRPDGSDFDWLVVPRATEASIGLLGAFVLSPTFDPQQVTIQLQREYDSMLQRSFTPLVVMSQRARGVFPGLDQGSPADDALGLAQITPALLRKIHECVMRPEGAELVVAGPVTPEAVETWARAALGSWSAARAADDPGCAPWLHPPAPEHPEQALLRRPELQVVHAPGETRLLLAVPGPPLESDDLLPFQLFADLLVDRRAGAARALWEAGATPRIHGVIDESYAHFSLLELEGAVAPALAGDALVDLTDEIRSLADTLTANALERAKRQWQASLATRLRSEPGLAGIVHWELRRGRSPGDVLHLFDEIEGVHLEQCRAVARRWLSAAQPSIVVSGSPVLTARDDALGAHVTELVLILRPVANAASVK